MACDVWKCCTCVVAVGSEGCGCLSSRILGGSRDLFLLKKKQARYWLCMGGGNVAK